MAELTMITTQEGLETILNTGIKGGADFNFKAFNNNVTITEATVIGDLTESSVYTDYTMLNANWVISYTTQGEALYNVSFQLDFTGTDTIYGVYITNSAGTELIGASNFVAPESVENGQPIIFPSVKITLDNV